MSDDKNWRLGRLAKIGLSAAVLPTLLVGLVALEQTDTGPSTTDGSELVKHLTPDNDKSQPDNDKSQPDNDKDQDDKDQDDNDKSQPDNDKDQDDNDKSQPDNDKDQDDKDQDDNDGEDNRCADVEDKQEQFECRNPSGVLP